MAYLFLNAMMVLHHHIVPWTLTGPSGALTAEQSTSAHHHAAEDCSIAHHAQQAFLAAPASVLFTPLFLPITVCSCASEQQLDARSLCTVRLRGPPSSS
ncbi:MAG: hypothetical protein JXA28_12440 [Bacteroidetes bacterium]|nr:hypothetical protein [Bacteroidota bacterium]